ncbi:glycosyltransferase family 2 protein [Thermodesulfobacteriota bacterium]
MVEMTRIAVLMTCHNRKDTTLSCLEKLYNNVLPENCLIDVFLVDDGSTDGTRKALQSQYPQLNIFKGNGNLFWNRGMFLAFKNAMRIGFDAYLWLNDDTMLYENAIAQLLQDRFIETRQDIIVVGAVCDAGTEQLTYGGGRFLAPKIRAFLYELIEPNGLPQEVDVMNGNIVLIPDSIAQKMGNLDPVFQHSMGDTDYAMRARKLGFKIFLTGQYVGTCSRNSPRGGFKDNSLPFRARLTLLLSPKGLPLRPWFTMCWRHGGLLWPIHFLLGYAKFVVRHF